MKNLKKKLLSLVMVACLVGAMFSMTGCGSESSGKNGSINIYVWTEYVPESVIDKFEKETGIKVNMSTFSSNEDMLAKVKSESEGAFDIVQPSDYMVKQMIDQGLLQTLDKEQLTNIENIGSQYLNQEYDPQNDYSIPYLGGIGAIAVNTKKIDLEVTSYDDLFNEAMKNSMVVLDDYRAVIGMTSKSMGYSMNETDPAVLSEVADKLMKLKSNIKLYDSDSPKSALISGDCTVAYCWSAEIALAMAENPDIEIIFPEEGAYKFFDNWCVCKGAKNYDNAMKFINFMMDSEVEQMVIEEYPYVNANVAAVDEMEDFKNDKASNIPADVMENAEFVKSLDNDTLAIYDEMWTKLKQ